MNIAIERSPSIALIIIGLLALSLGILAFLLDVAGWVRMPFTITFASFPGLIVVCVLSAYAKRIGETPLLSRLKAGLWAGLVATLVYDGTRLLVQATNIFDYNAFRAMPLFGSLITGLPPGTSQAKIAGWIYHFWNGISFAMMYALLAAGRHWLWGLAWAMFLETAMVFIYPFAFSVSRSNPSFITISFIGHAAYGVVLGLWLQRIGLEHDNRGDMS